MCRETTLNILSFIIGLLVMYFAGRKFNIFETKTIKFEIVNKTNEEIVMQTSSLWYPSHIGEVEWIKGK